jgi:hypothetical protein
LGLSELDDCIHHWVIESTAKTKTWLNSICKKCNATRLFKQSMVKLNAHEENVKERLKEEQRRAKRVN